MARREDMDLMTKFSGDPSGFQKAVGDVIYSYRDLSKEQREALKQVKEAERAAREEQKQAAEQLREHKAVVQEYSGALNEVGGAVGGATGEITGMFSSLMAAAGPIGIIVALIGGIAEAWNSAKEAIDDYLNATEKENAGPILQMQDAAKARKETRKQATGGVIYNAKEIAQSSNRIDAINENIHVITVKYMNAPGEKPKELTPEDQAKLKTLQEEKTFYENIITKARELKSLSAEQWSQVTGIKNRVQWEAEYANILDQEEKISKEKLRFEAGEEIIIQNKIKEQRNIIRDPDNKNASSKKAAEAEYEKNVNLLYGKRVELENSLYAIKVQKLEKENKSEEVDLLTIQHTKNINELETQRLDYIGQENRLKTAVNKANLLDMKTEDLKNKKHLETLSYLDALVYENEKLPVSSAKYLDNLKKINEVSSDLTKKKFNALNPFAGDIGNPLASQNEGTNLLKGENTTNALTSGFNADVKQQTPNKLAGFGGLGDAAIDAIKLDEAFKSIQENLPKVDNLFTQMGGLMKSISLTGKDVAEKQKETIGKLTGSFSQIFSTILTQGKGAWKALGDGFKNMLTEMLAQFLAKAAIFSLLKIITGGTGDLFKSLGGFSKFVTGGMFAEGTDSAPGGLSLVGERGPELVNLPKGSQVFTATETKSILKNNDTTQNKQSSLKEILSQKTGLDKFSELSKNSIAQKMLSFKDISKSIPGFENGTSFSPAGVAMVGERGPETIKTGNNRIGTKNTFQHDTLITKIAGKDIDIVLKRYQLELNSNT